MPDGILPDEGIGDQLEYILKRPIPGVLPWQLLLWVNDIEPDHETVLDDLEEATFSGYARVDVDRALWTTPEVDNGCATSTWQAYPTVWHVTGGPIETVYGYAMIDVVEGVIRFIQRFEDADIAPTVIGARLALLPRYTLTSAACPGA